MIRAVKYRIYPNKAQQELILKHFGCARFVYNYFLNYRQERYAPGMLDDRSRVKIDKSRVGITRSYACGDSSCGASKYGKVFAS